MSAPEFASGARPETVRLRQILSNHRWIQLAALELQVVLAVVLFHAFHLESESLRHGLLALVVAFPVNVLLPAAWRLPFFGALSVASVFLVAGWTSGLWILGLGGVLIGLCHVPIPFGWRIVLIVAAGAGLGLLRATAPAELPRPWSDLVWPILGSMFMFRLVVYLYDLRHGKAPFGFWRAVGYFFMAPNVWFPLFPVVDYHTFCKTVKESERFTAHQVGLRWIFRGILQLLLYRLVYQHTLIDPVDVDSVGTLFQFMLTTFLLYLRISGSFHVIVGLLRLFDFDLPETHHLYYLSSGFSDLWRRINIYWKDFIQKLFFYPLFFRLRAAGPMRALVGATLLSFLATWFFHSYQWFWFRGSLLVTETDIAFWAILAALVSINAVLESRPRAGSGRVEGRRLSKLRLAIQTVATFLIMCTLWTLWSATSFAEFLGIIGQAQTVRATEVAGILAVLGVIGFWAVWESRPMQSALAQRRHALRNSWRSAGSNVVLGLALLLLTLYPLQVRLPAAGAEWLLALESPALNDRDLEQLQRGYYEDLTQVHRFSHELATLYGERPPDYFVPWREAMRVVTDDYLGEVLLPSRDVEYMNVRYTTNTWGMRDQQYARERPDGVTRVALIGSSYTLGWGVEDDATYESIAERTLNPDGPARYELLNFAVHAYDPVRNLMTLEQRVLPFAPQYAILFCNTNERETLINNLSIALEAGVPLPYPELEAACRAAGVDAATPRDVVKSKLEPVGNDLVAWAFRSFADRCHEAGVVAVWMFMAETAPRFEDRFDEQIPLFFEMARQAGFDVVTDLRPAFDGVDGSTLKLFPWDFHPNAEGHRLLASYFTRVLRDEVFRP